MPDFMTEEYLSGDAWRGQWWNVHCSDQFEGKSYGKMKFSME